MEAIIEKIVEFALPYLASAVIFLMVLLLGWFGVEIKKEHKERIKTKVKGILNLIYITIMDVEKQNPELPGEEKKLKVLNRLNETLNKEEKKLIKKEEGGLFNAIEDQFKKYAQPVITGVNLIKTITSFFRK